MTRQAAGDDRHEHRQAMREAKPPPECRSRQVATQARDREHPRGDGELIRGRIMAGVAIVTALLVTSLAGYAMVYGDRELLSEVWSLTRVAALAIIGWGGGKGVLQLLSKIHLEDESSRPPTRSRGP